MKKFFIPLLLSTVLSACVSFEKSIQRVNLFNFTTNDLKNWKQVGEGKFVIKNHQLQSSGGMGLLYSTKQKFGNVKIHVIYKVNYADTNSGIFVRIEHPPKDAWDAVHHGYEIQICDKGKDAFDSYHITGAVYTFSPANHLATYRPGEWNNLDIILMGTKIIVVMNGAQVSQYTTGNSAPKRGRYSDPQRGPRPINGYIGIQNHDHDATHPDSHVYFKEISISPLY